MRVRAVVPVEEALEVDFRADRQSLNSLVNVGILTAEVGLNADVVGLVANRNVEVALYWLSGEFSGSIVM